jgi:hypothetical protein
MNMKTAVGMRGLWAPLLVLPLCSLGCGSVEAPPATEAATASTLLARVQPAGQTRVISFYGNATDAISIVEMGEANMRPTAQLEEIQPTTLFRALSDGQEPPAALVAAEARVRPRAHWRSNPDSALLQALRDGNPVPNGILADTNVCASTEANFYALVDSAPFDFQWTRFEWWNGLYFNYTASVDLHSQFCAITGPLLYNIAGHGSWTLTAGQWIKTSCGLGTCSLSVTVTSASGKEFDFWAAAQN